MTRRFVGRYRVEGLLGTGAFASVHLVHDEQLDDRVAIKLLAHNHTLDPDMRRRFIAEGQTLRRISSPHVIAVHDLGEADDGRPFLILEFADRGTLADRVARLRRLGWTATDADIIALARPLAAAMTALHNAAVVHRDIGPANILIVSASRKAHVAEPGTPTLFAADEVVKLTDLGLCKDLAAGSGLTVGAGTEGFRAPEQYTAGTVDARADLWAAAAVLFWTATGTTVTDTSDPAGALVESELTEAVQSAILTALGEDPDSRPATAAHWLAQLEQAAPPDASAADPVQFAPPRTTRDRDRRWWAGPRAAAAVLGVAGLLVGGAVVLQTGQTIEVPDGTPTFDAVTGEWIAIGIDAQADTDVDVSVIDPAGTTLTEATIRPDGGTVPAVRIGVAGAHSVVATDPDGRPVAITFSTVRPFDASQDPINWTFDRTGVLLQRDITTPTVLAAGWHGDLTGLGGCSTITIFTETGAELGTDTDCEQPANGGITSSPVHVAERGTVLVHMTLAGDPAGSGAVAFIEPTTLDDETITDLEAGPAGVLISRELQVGDWFAGGARLDTTPPTGCAQTATLGPDGTRTSALRVCDADGARGVGTGPVPVLTDGPQTLHVRFNAASGGTAAGQIITPTTIDPASAPDQISVGPAGMLLAVVMEMGEQLAVGYTDGVDLTAECARSETVPPGDVPGEPPQAVCDGPPSGQLEPANPEAATTAGVAIAHVKIEDAPTGSLTPTVLLEAER